MRRWRRRLRAHDDSGFSLIELGIAGGLLFSVVILLAYAGVVALVDVSHSRQRQAATGLANQALEEVRALPFATVALGLVTADIATMTDPNIIRSGATGTYSYAYRGETIPHGTHATRAPLLPHRRTVQVEQTTYQVATYVTRYRNSVTNNTYRVTTEVTWQRPMRRGTTAKVEAQTIMYPGGGCQSAATHPYAAPCLAFFDASAQVQPGAIEISGTILGTAIENGGHQIPVIATLYLPSLDATVKHEQVSSVISNATTAGVSLTADDAEQNAGRLAASAVADSDPASTRGAYETSTSAFQAPATPWSGGVNPLALIGSSTDQSTASSAAQASPAGAPCSDDSALSEGDAEPCGRASAAQPTPMSATLDLNNPAALGTVTLASVDSDGPGVPASVFGMADRDTAGTTACSGTGDGCAKGRANRVISNLRIGGVPAAAGSGAWAGHLVSLSLADEVRAWSGTGVAGPAASQSGAVRFWNGSGYDTIDLTDPSHSEGFSSSFSWTSGDTTVTLMGDFTVGRASTDASACVAPCALPSATATAASPLTGEISYRVVKAGVTVADLVIKVDVGAVSASARWKAAPSAG